MPETIEVSKETLQQLHDLMNRGRALSAWNLAQEQGPLERWAPGRALWMASWILAAVGAERLSQALDWQNWRANRDDPKAYFDALFSRLRCKAPVFLLPELARWLARPDLTPQDRGNLLAFQAWAFATLKDFPPAHESIEQALALAPEEPWIHIQQSSVLEMEDRYAEALAAVERAVALRPHYRPAVLQQVDCLIHLGRDDEAIELLLRAHRESEQGAFAIRLQSLYSEREDHARGLWCLGEAERLMPRMDEPHRQWLARRTADFRYLAGDLEGCLEACDRSGPGFHEAIAAKLRRPEAPTLGRRRLEVPFIRQHRMTCAPATLASLAKFWGRDHDHLEIAAAICYDGTPWHKERGWGEAHGFIAREFRFTREILAELIDRGIPFTLTTSWVTGAHLQACIGYDLRKDVVLLRDPTHRHFGEVLIDGLLKAHPIDGPRCMLLLPVAEEARLAGLTLPGEALFEAHHRFQIALERHDRWAAEEAISTLRALAPDGLLTLDVEAMLASYLGHPEKCREKLQELVRRLPDHQPLQYRLLGVLKRLDDTAAVRDLLESEVMRKGGDPVFISELGSWLLKDARQLARARRYLRRAVLRRSGEAGVYVSLSALEMKEGRFEEATRLRRFGATLGQTIEPYAMAYFDGCRLLGRTQQGIDFLTERARRLGRIQSASWITLAQALDAVNRDPEARAILEDAVNRLPEDGELRLSAGEMMISWGEEDRRRGLEWMEQARGRVAENLWFRQCARIAAFLGDRRRAMQLWRGLIDREPAAADAHASLAQLIAEESGREEAVTFVVRAAQAHPRQAVFWNMLADWRESEDPAEALRAVDRSLALDPDDVWVLRRRALLRFQAGDHEGGLADAREALERAPGAPESHGVHASLLHRAGSGAESRAGLEAALRLRIDYTFALERRVGWAADSVDAIAAVGWIEQEMLRQVSNGDCVPVFQQMAWPVLPPPDLLEKLRGFCEARPDLWQTWSARLDHCLAMDLPGEATLCADRLRAAFPLLPRTWVEAAKVAGAAGDHEGEAAFLRRALDLSPGWDDVSRQLGEVLERLGHYEEARQVLERAILHGPLEGANHGCLASLLHKTGQPAKAFEILLRTAETCPYYRYGWFALCRWSSPLGRRDEVIAAVRAGSARRSHHAAWWLLAIDLWHELDLPDESLAAARRGLELHPGSSDLRDQLAMMLGTLGHSDEALEVCCAGGEKPPTRELEGRRAWVLMEAGRAKEALAAMEALVAREPDYAWGWARLAEWYGGREDWPALERAAGQWTRHSPDEAVAFGHLGWALAELGKNDAARRAFERGHRLDPSYQYVGRRLLHMQMESGDFTGAERTLGVLRHYTPGPWVEAEAVELLLKQNRIDEAFALARGMAGKATDARPLEALMERFRPLGWRMRWVGELEAGIRAKSLVSPAVLASWAGGFDKDSLAAAGRKLKRFKISEEARNAAWEVLLRASAEARDPGIFQNWVRRHRKRFQADPQLWRTVGERLLGGSGHAAAAKWLADWRQRGREVNAATFINLAAAIDGTKGPAAAVEARAEGITRFGTARDSYALRAGQACHFAAAGRWQEAAALLEPVEENSLSDYYRTLADLSQAVICAEKGDEEAAARLYKEALGRWTVVGRSGLRRHLLAIQKRLAKCLPWSKGRVSRLVRQWGNLKGMPGLSNTILWIAGLCLVIAMYCVAITESPAALTLPALLFILYVHYANREAA